METWLADLLLADANGSTITAERPAGGPAKRPLTNNEQKKKHTWLVAIGTALAYTIPRFLFFLPKAVDYQGIVCVAEAKFDIGA